MNLFYGTRAEVSPDVSAALLARDLGLTLFERGATGHTIGFAARLELWNPPVHPCGGVLLLSPGGHYGPRGAYLPRHDWLAAIAPRRAALAAVPALVGEPRLFLHWEPQDDRERTTAPWSLLVGHASARGAVLKQPRVRAAVRAAGMVLGEYTGFRVFGRCVARLTAHERSVDVDLEPALGEIQTAMNALLGGAGQRLRTDPQEGVQAYVCHSVVEPE